VSVQYFYTASDQVSGGIALSGKVDRTRGLKQFREGLNEPMTLIISSA